MYFESKDEDEDEEKENNLIPALELGKILDLIDMSATQKFSQSPPRYTEAALVKKLEELGIGRPSTYAPTISTIQKRDYVIKESRPGKERNFLEMILKNSKIKEETKSQTFGTEKNKLFPTNMAMIVNDFLIQNFPDVIDYSFTANVEKEFDEIAAGNKLWNKVIADFYLEFHENVERTSAVPKSTKDVTRNLGTDPKTGLNIYAKLGRYGAYVQIGESNEEEKPKFASLKKGQFLENITLEEAVELFKMPRDLGEYEGYKMTVAIGRFGPYVSHHSKFYSLGKEDDPYSILPDRAIELINNKIKADADKLIKTFTQMPEVKVLNGRWGPYLAIGRSNYKLPKGAKPEELTLDECIKIADSQPEKKKPEPVAKKTAVTATKKATPATAKTTAVKKAPAKKPSARKPATKKK